MTDKLQFVLPTRSPLLSPDFTYGVATSSFQIEGHRDKTQACIWDTFCKQPGTIRDHSDGTIACDHINNWEQDLELIASLGVDAYRFSIAWPRVLNTDGSVNAKGMGFYDGLVDKLLNLNIKPFVTLYHWDLPQVLEDKGGWLNRDTAFRFQEYTEKVCSVLGERVHSYVTLNEPFCSAYLGYEAGVHAPGITGQGHGRKAAHHLLLAHGLGMQVLRSQCPGSLNGLVLNISPAYPVSDTETDREAARIADDYHNQWYFKPVLDGKYPDLVGSLPVNNRPDIHPGDMELISQPLDFLGINYYTRMRCVPDSDLGFRDIGPDADMETTAMGWEVYPQALTDVLVDLNTRYTLPPVMITENGAATDDIIEEGRVLDHQRVNYYQSHLKAVHNATLKGVDVQGYFAWSLMDNFEWAEGYLKRFGIVYVDYETQERVLKESAKAYSALISARDGKLEQTA